MAENIYEIEGDYQLHTGDNTGAIKSYTQAIQQEPNNAKLYLKRAAAEDIEGMADEFFEDYTKATKLAPNTAEFYYAKSHLTYSFSEEESDNIIDVGPSKKQKLEALSYANKAIELDPNYASAYDWRAFLKKELNDYQGALEDHNKAIELVYDYYYFYFFRGETRSKIKDFGGAIKDYSKAIELNPKFAYAYKRRGNLLKKIGDKQNAKEDFKEAEKFGWHPLPILRLLLIIIIGIILIYFVPLLASMLGATIGQDLLIYLSCMIIPLILLFIAK